MKPKTKIFVSFICGAAFSFIGTTIYVNSTENILTDEQYAEYQTLTDKNNTIVAYRHYFLDSMRALKLVNDVFNGNFIPPKLMGPIETDVSLIGTLDKQFYNDVVNGNANPGAITIKTNE